MTARACCLGRARRRQESVLRPGTESRRVRIIIVDDSPFIVRSLADFFKRQAGFEVVGTAGSGVEAVDRVAELTPDLVLMDIWMPEMDGLEATSRIKAGAGAPVVILCTIEDGPSIRAVAKDVGADDFVAKAPRMEDTLRAALRRSFPTASLR